MIGLPLADDSTLQSSVARSGSCFFVVGDFISLCCFRSFVSPFPSCDAFVAGASTFKRSRSDAASPQSDLHKVVESQASEIEDLKHHKSNLESSLDSLKSEHEKVVNENRILKRAVAIQQERQNHAASEIEAARQYKFDAETQIKKLEQIILSLRYHLQTQQSNPSNDFMSYRPPDVY